MIRNVKTGNELISTAFKPNIKSFVCFHSTDLLKKVLKTEIKDLCLLFFGRYTDRKLELYDRAGKKIRYTFLVNVKIGSSLANELH